MKRRMTRKFEQAGKDTPAKRTTGGIVRSFVFEFLILAVIVAAVLTLVMVLDPSAAARPKGIFGMLFPAIAFGVIILIRFVLALLRR